MNPIKLIIAGILLVLGITTTFNSWYVVDQGEIAVVLRNGAVVDVAEPGLHFLTPFVEDYKMISTQSLKVVYNAMSTYSADQQPTNIGISVNYHAIPSTVKDLYAKFGTLDGAVDRYIAPKIPTITKNILGEYTAAKAIQNRAQLNTEINNAVIAAISEYVVVESVQVEHIKFSGVYEDSIEQRMLAEVDVQKEAQKRDKAVITAQATVAAAQGEADSNLAKTTAEAKGIKLLGEAEAYRIKARADALAQNQSIVALVTAERWDGKLPSTMVPGSSVPFVNVGK